MQDKDLLNFDPNTSLIPRAIHRSTKTASLEWYANSYHNFARTVLFPSRY